MTDEIDDELSGELGKIQYERIDAGSYVVIGELRINGRRIPCRNPAYGFGALDQEVRDLLAARARLRKIGLETLEEIDEVVTAADNA